LPDATWCLRIVACLLATPVGPLFALPTITRSDRIGH